MPAGNLGALFVTESAEDAAQTMVRSSLDRCRQLRVVGVVTNVPSLVICDETLATWLIADGRARRTPRGYVVLDLSQNRDLPDLVKGGDPAVCLYLRTFADALTMAGYGAHLITHRRRAMPATKAPGHLTITRSA